MAAIVTWRGACSSYCWATRFQRLTCKQIHQFPLAIETPDGS